MGRYSWSLQAELDQRVGELTDIPEPSAEVELLAMAIFTAARTPWNRNQGPPLVKSPGATSLVRTQSVREQPYRRGEPDSRRRGFCHGTGL